MLLWNSVGIAGVLNLIYFSMNKWIELDTNMEFWRWMPPGKWESDIFSSIYSIKIFTNQQYRNRVNFCKIMSVTTHELCISIVIVLCKVSFYLFPQHWCVRMVWMYALEKWFKNKKNMSKIPSLAWIVHDRGWKLLKFISPFIFEACKGHGLIIHSMPCVLECSTICWVQIWMEGVKLTKCRVFEWLNWKINWA
jgi:hypothetical protein